MARSKNASRAAVLIVDDEASIRESLRMILEYEGYRVEEAVHGADALVRVADSAPDGNTSRGTVRRSGSGLGTPEWRARA